MSEEIQVQPWQPAAKVNRCKTDMLKDRPGFGSAATVRERDTRLLKPRLIDDFASADRIGVRIEHWPNVAGVTYFIANPLEEKRSLRHLSKWIIRTQRTP